MYVCMYVYICTYTYIYIYIYIRNTYMYKGPILDQVKKVAHAAKQTNKQIQERETRDTWDGQECTGLRLGMARRWPTQRSAHCTLGCCDTSSSEEVAPSQTTMSKTYYVM